MNGKKQRSMLVAAITASCIGAVTAPFAHAETATAGKDRATLQSVSLLFRHSVISPKYQLPKSEVAWPMGFRQLTAVGIKHMYRNGEALRNKYVKELGLISGSYKLSDLYVRASNTDRALQSAQMLVLGLYPLGTGPNPAVFDKSLTAAPSPELAFTPVPVHAVALSDDKVMRPWTGAAGCKTYRKYVKSLRKTDTYKKQAKKFEKFLLRVSAATGVNEGKKRTRILYDINEIYEPLSANVQHYLPLPKGISARDMEVMKALSDWNYHHQFLGKEVGRLTGGPFVGEVVKNFEQFIKDPAKAKRLYIYSGHQRTTLGVEAALGIETARTKGALFEGRVPPLGSHYAFELHKLDDGQPAVKVKFVDGARETTMRVPGCSGEMCPFKEFKKVASDVVPENWRAECTSGSIASSL